jgi:hypothetical protein
MDDSMTGAVEDDGGPVKNPAKRPNTDKADRYNLGKWRVQAAVREAWLEAVANGYLRLAAV